LYSDDASTFTTIPVAATTATNQSSVGAYPISVSLGSSPNYDITPIGALLTVTPADLNATSNFSRAYGDPNPNPLPISYSGFVNGDGPSSISTPPVAVTSPLTTVSSPVGNYTT